jgi:peptidoglycan/LPS O-acetylase OafA/YrhL
VCAAGVVWLVVDAWLPAGGAVWMSVEYSATALFWAAVVGVVLRGGWLAHALAWRPMRWVGRYSYGAYLVHLPIWFFLALPAKHWMAARGIRGAAASVGVGAGVMVLALIVAVVMFEVWEKRFLRLKKYFAYERAEEMRG